MSLPDFGKPALRWNDYLVAALSLVFLTLASVSHTIALRYTILVLLLGFAALERHSVQRLWREQQAPLLAVWGFLAYALLHTFLLSHWFNRSIGEFYNQLLVGGLWFTAGLILFRRWRGLSVADMVILAGVMLASVELAHGLVSLVTTGVWPFAETFTTDTKLEFTFFMNFVLGFIAAVFCFGNAGGPRFSRLPKWLLILGALIILLASVRAGARNGMIGMVYLVLSIFIIYTVFEGFRFGWKRTLTIASLLLVGIVGVIAFAIHQDSRNKAFFESVDAGWHYQRTEAWLRIAPLPNMSNGQPVDGSAYERVAWIHSGLDLIRDNPLGYGFARNTFGLALQYKGYHPNTVAHSHSGFIDFGIGLGLIGVLLWAALCLVFIYRGFRAFRSRKDALGLALMLVTAGYLGRMMMESINKDHMLHIFLFTAGAVLAELALRGEASEVKRDA
ncbi:O-antigen ligase family protein [uncultured Aquitalea sp.]|uniref:O-antigen ligase family protein n=1 Tax=uncultured Aquitalea sp. TaxID=540272 RepID=UPI0025E269FA|nr:O-antigen ligase family protein [uncultured Aquitalea sp.]